MTVKVAINGFGRIGRLVARAVLERGDTGLELVAINDLADAKSNAWLFSRDSVHGKYPGKVSAEGNELVVDGKRIRVTAERDPANLPHAELGVDIVLECTGFFTDRESVQKHIDAGAKKVLISAPGKGGDLIAVALTDILSDGLSMVYSFFEPGEENRSMGTFMILDHIARARRLGLPYVYLGYWIEGSRKMDYKARFLPQQRLAPSGWLRVDATGSQALEPQD